MNVYHISEISDIPPRNYCVPPECRLFVIDKIGLWTTPKETMDDRCGTASSKVDVVLARNVVQGNNNIMTVDASFLRLFGKKSRAFCTDNGSGTLVNQERATMVCWNKRHIPTTHHCDGL